jgi:NUDIX domain-containing protein
MYKIFINQTAVYLFENAIWEKNSRQFEGIGPCSIFYVNEEWEFRPFYDKIMLEPKNANQILLFENRVDMDLIFFNHFQRIEAAGGVVFNEYNEMLFIFRNEKWDLPKGKIDPGEAGETTALREVQEETGIRDLRILRPAPLYNGHCTYHTYTLQDKLILKPTYWYLMSGNKKETLAPQNIENITKAEWIGQGQLQEILKNTYPSILDVVEACLNS